jgi:hypothetical protein
MYGVDEVADIASHFEAHIVKEGRKVEEALIEYRHFKIYAKNMRSAGLKRIFLDIWNSGRLDLNAAT